jgi:hypothetical protein
MLRFIALSVFSLLATAVMVDTAAEARENVRPEFSLVGFYDMSSVMGVAKRDGSQFRWVPSQALNDSCGDAKAPFNMNIMEAEASASGMNPTLVVVLRREGELEYINRKQEACTRGSSLDCRVRPITNEDLHVGLGVTGIDFSLQPMVMPRNVYVSLRGSFNEQDSGVDGGSRSLSGSKDSSRYEKLVKTQVELELCLEHKVGRGWMGGDKKQLRQGFLLDPADEGENDRKFFNGQRDPIPALIGAPNACLDSRFSGPSMALKGKNDLIMTPSDIWGATLPACVQATKDRPLARKGKHLPFQITKNGSRMLQPQRQFWSILDIEVSANGPSTDDVLIDVLYNGEKVFSEKRLFPIDGDRNSIIDILPELPYEYPSVGTKDDPDAYVVLMIPNWQIVEGLRRMFSRVCGDTTGATSCECSVASMEHDFLPNKEISKLTEEDFTLLKKRMSCKDIDGKACTLSNKRPLSMDDALSPLEICYKNQKLSTPMNGVGGTIFDGVGWILNNPQNLFVQVPTYAEQDQSFSVMDYLPGRAKVSTSGKPNIMDAVGGAAGKIGIRNWGYTVGLLSGRAPIVSLGTSRLSWEQSANVQHARQHSYFIVAACSLCLFLFVGIRRFPDYWTNTPQERAYYWPGRQADNDQSEPEGIDAEGAEGLAEAGGGEE